MIIYRNPKRTQWGEITSRPRLDLAQLNETVSTVLNDVRQRGDEAVKEYELKFDKAALTSLAVSEQEMQEAEQLVSAELKAAIELAHENIYKFHAAQKFEGQKVETQSGVSCWQKSVAIERVGLYIPGGTAPLFSTVLMLATPAKIAGQLALLVSARFSKLVVYRLSGQWLTVRNRYPRSSRFSVLATNM